jgi:type II secretory pathway predicted ATPase ExeA/tetratricopeptide (TPR) repeat protein
MILQYYGMREDPFGVTPNPHYLYLSPRPREALATLIYGIEAGYGFMALIGKPGTGKTTLLYELLERLGNAARTVFLFQTQCNSCEFFRYLLSDMGLDSKGQDMAGMHEQLNRVLLTEARAGRRFVLIIDEAQNLADSMLEAVRLLSDFETPRAKLIQIILAGQPQLAERLARPEMAQLRQRISLLARLEPFGPEETRAYIDHRLKVAGYTQSRLFTAEAMEMIVARGKGIPRDINNICFNALSLGFALQKKQIDSAIVQEVLSDLNLDTLIDEAPPGPKIGPQTELPVQEPIERDVQQGAQRIARPAAFAVGVLGTAVFVTVCLVLLLTEKPKSGALPSLPQTASASTSKTDSSSNIDAEQASAIPPSQPYQGSGLVPRPLDAVRATVSGHSKVSPAEASLQVKPHPKSQQGAQRARTLPSQVKALSSSRNRANDATSAAADPAEKTQRGALATYRQAVQWSPTDPATHPNLAHALQAEDDLSGAAMERARLADIGSKQHGIDFDPTEEYLASLQKADAEPVLLYAQRAANRTKSGAPDDGGGLAAAMQQGSQTGPKSGQQAESAAPSRPHVTSQTGADTFRSHLEAGRALLAQTRPDEAAEEFRQALHLQPDSAESHRALTVALFDKGDLDGAIAEYRRVIRLEAGDVSAHIDLGLALYVKDDLDGAVAEYGEAVRLDPKDPINHFLLGKALAKKRNLEACIAELRDAVRLRPDFAEAHDALGSALEQKKDLRSALAQYQIAHSLEPHNLNYRFRYEHLSHALGH